VESLFAHPQEILFGAGVLLIVRSNTMLSAESNALQFPARVKDIDNSDRKNATAEPAVSEWLTAEEAAQYLKVKPRTALKWAKEGRIPGHSLCGSKRVTWRFLKSELFSMLASPPAAELWRVQQ
jgi:excisionase family DNA binding protein